jgi:hypothetical protein
VYIRISKEYFEKNREKWSNAGQKEFNEECYLISTNGSAEMLELAYNNTLTISEQLGGENGIYVSLDFTPEPDTIVGMVENEIDNIRGDALVRIIQSIVSKLNKYKNLIETMKSL